MDELRRDSAPPGYEPRDANVRAVFLFLAILGAVLVTASLMCWGLFHYLSTHAMERVASDSPFANTRQLPLGPELQVNPRADWLKFRAEQQKDLETYAWENRSAGMVRVPIDEAMELLVKKGVPVQGAAPAQPAESKKPPPEGANKP